MAEVNTKAPTGDRPAADPGTVIVEVRGAGRSFVKNGRRMDALRDIDLTVRKNEFVSLIGPSGCGKSTLLSLVSGLLPPSTGNVAVMGQPVRGTPDRVGMMLQTATLLDWRTAIDNVLLPIEVRDGRRKARQKTDRAKELLSLVGLEGSEDVYPHQLSGGMQQRVAICRMLIADPALMLLDEPFAALDELTREDMNELLESIFTYRGDAAVFVTHNLNEAVYLSDRVLVMATDPGRIVADVPIPLPRPRSPELATTEEFQQLVRRVRGELHV